jgi:predicted SnoaL-like aldol condensation-catalyzing enzyme
MTILFPTGTWADIVIFARDSGRGESYMSVNENKAVVRRFTKEVLSGGNIDLIDELVAPNFVNPTMGVANRAGFKAMLSGIKATMPVHDTKIENLVAEGDSVVARGTLNMTLANGKNFSARFITYYRLSNGKIVEDDPMTTPDLTQVLGDMMKPKSGS